MRRRLWIALAGALAGATGLGGYHILQGDRQFKSAVDALRQRSFMDAQGRPQSLAQWSGKTLLVNFWATWCTPCREEVPALIRLQSRYKNLQVVGICIDDVIKVQEFAKSFGINYPLLFLDWTGLELLRQLGNQGAVLPYTLLLSPEGRTVTRHLGALTEQQWDALIIAAI